jgi:hypothetical protein
MFLWKSIASGISLRGSVLRYSINFNIFLLRHVVLSPAVLTKNDRREKRIRDREVIVGQIKHREKQKMMEEEARERENQQMLALMRKYDEDDSLAAEKRKVEVARSKLEIMEANAESIRRKQDSRLKDIQEMDALKMYQVSGSYEAHYRT